MQGGWQPRVLIAFVILASVCFGIFFSPSVAAIASFSWTNGSFTTTSEDVPATYTSVCQVRHVQIGGPFSSESADICVYERPNWRYGLYSKRIDLGYMTQYEHYFVVGIGSDQSMYIVDNLSGTEQPLETQASNDLLYSRLTSGFSNNHRLDVIRNLPSHLQRTSSLNGVHYTVSDGATETLIVGEAGNPVTTGAVGVSANGRWLAVEVMGVGLVRYDTKNGSLRGFSNFKVSYGYGSDAHIAFAVSNDGSYIGTFDYNIEPHIYTLDATCGVSTGAYNEAFTAAMQSSETAFCPTDGTHLRTSLETKLSSSTVRGLSQPEFSYDGGQLTLKTGSPTSMENELVVTVQASGYDDTRLAYLALGDSYSSGEGDVEKDKAGHDHYLSLTDLGADKCHISSRSYPFILKDYWSIPAARMKSIACSGAQVVFDYNRPLVGYMGQGGRLAGRKDIANAQATALDKFIPGRVPQLEFVKKYQPDIITLTGGGNDVGFVDMLTYCAYGSGDINTTWKLIKEAYFGRFTCAYATPNSSVQQIALKAIEDQYAYTYDLLEAIKQASPQSTIYLIGYPSFVGTGSSCFNALLLDQVERQSINYFQSYLNKQLFRAATDAGATYIDIQDSLKGGRLCEGSEYMTGPWNINITDENERRNLFHPNAKGHQRMGGAIEQKVSSPSAPSDEDKPASVGSALDSGSVGAVDMTAGDLNRNGTIEINIPSYTFSPYTNIALTLHSDPRSLGAIHADADGGYTGTISVSDLPAGFHLLTAEGSSYSGEALTLYQFLTVGAAEDNKISQTSSHPMSDEGNTPPQGSTGVVQITRVGGRESEHSAADADIYTHTPLAVSKETVKKNEVSTYSALSLCLLLGGVIYILIRIVRGYYAKK